MPSTWPRHVQSPWPCLGFHLLLSLVGIQSCSKMALEWDRALQSCLNIAQGKRNAGARPGCSKNSPEPAAHSSASFGTARSQASGQAQQARAVQSQGLCPMPGWQGQSVQFSPSLLLLGLGTPVALEILKSVSEGAVKTPGMCWGSACSSFPAHLPSGTSAVPDPVPGGEQG